MAATAEFPVAITGHNNDKPLMKVGWRLEEIFDRDKGLRIAVKPNVGDARCRHQIQHSVGKRNPRAEHRSEYQLLTGNSRRFHLRQRRLDFDFVRGRSRVTS